MNRMENRIESMDYMEWNGMEWNEWIVMEMTWNGMNGMIKRNGNGMEWNGIKKWNGMESKMKKKNGIEWNEEWNGMESNEWIELYGMESRMEWNGIEWNGME